MGTNLLSFPRYFDANVTHVRIVPKSSSDFMRRLGNLIDFATTLHLTNITREQFLHDYTTTLWDTIYSDEIDMDSAPSELMVHELCHVLQFNVRSMPVEYVLSPRKRAYYESEATQAAMLCFPVLRFDVAYVDRKVAHLTRYGIRSSVAREEILARIGEVQRDEPRARARRVENTLRAWREL